MTTFSAGQKQIHIYPSVAPGRPVIYLNTFAQEEPQILAAMQQAQCPDCSLIAVSGLDWDRDMSPWAVEDKMAGGPYAGGATEHLRFLADGVLPRAEQALAAPTWRGVAGYSLAGLFALFCLYQTDLFSRAASVSGSLWFPGFLDYARSHEWKRQPEHLYFSLGSQEHKTRNPYRRTVRQNTQEMEALCRGKGIDTVLQINPGNHFRDSAARTAAGICWLLSR